MKLSFGVSVYCTAIYGVSLRASVWGSAALLLARTKLRRRVSVTGHHRSMCWPRLDHLAFRIYCSHDISAYLPAMNLS